MESKFVFRDGKYKLVHTTNTLKDNLIISSSVIEPEIDNKLKKLEFTVNSAHLPLICLRKVIRALFAILTLLLIIWVVCWIIGVDKNDDSLGVNDTLSIRNGQLIESNGRVVKNGYLSCSSNMNGENPNFNCKYFNGKYMIAEVKDKSVSDTPVAGESTIETIEKKVPKEIFEQSAKETIIEEVKEPVKEIVREPVKEIVREPVREIVREPVREIVREVVREPIREIVREPIREIMRDPVIETVRETYVEPTKNIYKEVYSEPVREVVRDTYRPLSVETIKQSNNDYNQDYTDQNTHSYTQSYWSPTYKETVRPKQEEQVEKPFTYEDYQSIRSVQREEPYESQITEKKNYKEKPKAESHNEHILNDSYREYNSYNPKTNVNHKRDTKPIQNVSANRSTNSPNYSTKDLNDSYQTFINNKNNSYDKNYTPRKEYSYDNEPYRYFDNSRRLQEANSNIEVNNNLLINSNLEKGLQNTNNDAYSVRSLESVDDDNKIFVEDMPIEVDEKWYRISRNQNPQKNDSFLLIILMLILVVLVLELCVRVINLKTEKYLNNSIAHLVSLENRSSNPIKLIMNSEYLFIEVKVMGIIEPQKDQELTSEDNYYKSSSDPKHYLERKLGKLQKKAKKHKPKYDNYINPSDDSLDISISSDVYLARKTNTEASFVLNPNK